MKKFLSLALSVLFLLMPLTTLISCDSDNSADITDPEISKAVELNVHNYDDYIELTCTKEVEKVPSYGNVYNQYLNLEASGNSHYKYNDVTITVKIKYYETDGGYQKYLEYLAKTAAGDESAYCPRADDEITIDIDLNLAGNGKNNAEIIGLIYIMVM